MAVTDQQLGTISLFIKKLEHVLESIGAKGTSINEQIDSLNGVLPEAIMKQLKSITTVYNKALNQNYYEIPDITQFEKSSIQTLVALKKFAVLHNKKLNQKSRRKLFFILLCMGAAIIAAAFLFK